MVREMLLVTALLLFQAHRVESHDYLPQILRYETDASANFVPLSVRRRRAPRSDVDDGPASWTIPPDYEEEKDTVDHTYYTKKVMNQPGDLEKHFVNIDEMLKKDGVLGNSSHPLLSGSYRRAVGAKLSFSFPFYGHFMNNLTIATGGFIYIGDQQHNWLAATQYIAPLMANFDTNVSGSNIIYADDGQKFVVEWRKVQLREQTEEGQFTFQAILHKNGDIVYAYKDVPTNVANISDSNHPVKLGISDAYLFNHFNPTGSSTSPPKRVIYEYHRIEIPPEEVKSNTVIFLEAQPTCIGITSCDQCFNATLKYFTCSWCKSENGGSFCTDEAGLHRRRQHWIEGNCQNQKNHPVCTTEDSTTNSPSAASGNPDSPEISRVSKSKSSQTQNNGFAGLVFLLGLALSAIGWLTYAYYNPHTTSGQLLIKYRPSRWHVPNSHVRYSASSVHM